MGRNKGNKNQQPREAELTNNKAVGWRVADNVVQRLIEKYGHVEEGILGRLYLAAEEAFTSTGADFLFAGIAGYAEVPDLFRKALVKHGVPPEMVALCNTSLDSYIRNIGRTRETTGRLTGRDIDMAFTKTEARNPTEQEISLQDAIASLPSDQQIVFREKYAVLVLLGEEVKAKFAAYSVMRKQRQALMSVVYALIAQEPITWLQHLELTLGTIKDPTAATAVSGIKSYVGKLGETLTGAAKKINEPITPAEQLSVDERQRAVEKKTNDIKTRRKNRTW